MSMADLITERRKEKGMTQRQLAEKIGVTDKAVSKWERGYGQPDINFLQPLSEALDINVSELLKGEIKSSGKNTDDEVIVKKTLDYASNVYKDRSRNIPRIVMITFLVLGLTGIITTSIVDFALNGGFTWSIMPITAIIFSCLCIIPMFFFKKHNVNISLLSTSIFIFPFLFIISEFTKGNWFASIAVPMAISGVVILWLIRAVFVTKLNIWSKFAASMIVTAAGSIVISFILGNILPGAGFDIWNLIGVAILIVIALILFVIGRSRKVPSGK